MVEPVLVKVTVKMKNLNQVRHKPEPCDYSVIIKVCGPKLTFRESIELGPWQSLSLRQPSSLSAVTSVLEEQLS